MRYVLSLKFCGERICSSLFEASAEESKKLYDILRAFPQLGSSFDFEIYDLWHYGAWDHDYMI